MPPCHGRADWQATYGGSHSVHGVNAHRLGGAFVALVGALLTLAGLVTFASRLPALAQLISGPGPGVPEFISVGAVAVGLLLFELGALAFIESDRLSRRKFD